MAESRPLPAFNLDALVAAVEKTASGEGRPPVEKWTPDRSGEMDLTIRKDGSWWHEGAEMSRERLKKLFASVLKREGDDYYLVTPVEKWQIDVDVAPFLITQVDVSGEGSDRRIFFTTQFGDSAEMTADNPLRVKTDPDTLEPEPTILVRNDLPGLLSRAVFYELADLAEERETPEGPQLGVIAGGHFHPLGPAGIHR